MNNVAYPDMLTDPLPEMCSARVHNFIPSNWSPALYSFFPPFVKPSSQSQSEYREKRLKDILSLPQPVVIYYC